MSIRHLLLVATLPLLCTGVLAQAPGANWSQTPTPSDPPLRRENPGASDGSLMYVFGGQSGGSGGVPMNDLWAFDGATWTELIPDGAPGSPPARDRAGITWDFGLNRLVVFGGEDSAGNALGDTWHWDPMTSLWSDVTPAGVSPSARKFCALAYDWANLQVLLFGGLDGGGAHLNDTWHFDGTTWSPLAPVGALPGLRRQHVLVERPELDDIILCGGQEAGGAGMLGDTWQWDGMGWNLVPTTGSPAGKVAIDAAYDQVRRRIVIAGGNPGPTGSISEFDSLTNDWVIRPLDPGIYKVTRYFMAFLATTGKVYKVSGQALNAAAPAQNTYEYESDTVATFTMSGTACPGGAGIPTLTATDAPWLERPISISVANVAPGEIVYLLAGIDNTNWMGLPLPADGNQFGAPGCFLHVSPLLWIPLGIGPAPAAWSLLIPNDPGLLGIPIYLQGVMSDPGLGTVSATGLGTAVFGML